MLDWIPKVLPKHLHIHLNVNFSALNNIKINSENRLDRKQRPVIDVDGDYLVIDDATPEGKEIAQTVIKELPNHIKHDDVVLDEAGSTNYRRIDEGMSDPSFDEQFVAYKPMVASKDVPVLEIAILIKIKFDRGETVSDLKSQAIQRYGMRANMICNLYTSGYFSSLIKPLYERIASGELAMDDYLQFYETMVTESPLAMFIGVTTSFLKAKEELLRKIQINQTSEIGYLNIHGIGAINTGLIKRLLADEEVTEHFSAEPTVKTANKTYIATIYL